jgi:glycosyltransferase involved in cell wall biosynthesis
MDGRAESKFMTDPLSPASAPFSLQGLLACLPPPPPGRTGWPWTEETSPDHYGTPPTSGRWPKLSIVCPSFRQGRFIEETIRSVLLQNYPALEFIVIDGGSDDETVPILQKYSPWLTHWESQPDRGQSHALSKGFSRATGELFGWINSDDYYLPGAFAALARRAKPGQTKCLFYGHHVQFDESTGRREPLRMPKVFAFEIYAGGFTLPSHATFWTAAAHQPFDESLRFIMDADLFKRIAAAGAQIVRVDAVLGVFRLHQTTKTATISEQGRVETEQWLARMPKRHWWLWWQCHRVLMRLRRTR